MPQHLKKNKTKNNLKLKNSGDAGEDVDVEAGWKEGHITFSGCCLLSL